MLTLVFLVLAIVFIVVSSTRFNLHPFLSLLIAAIFVGFSGGLDAAAVITAITDGFGSTLKSIGIVIAFGAIIGVFLERSGGAQALAAFVLKLVGEKRAPLAMNITGYIVSIPVFCDSGFVILSALNKAISKKTGLSMTILAVALATGLYSTHVFVPPTPGPLAAAATLNVDIGLVILLGLVVAIPASLAGLLWACFYGKRFHVTPQENVEAESVRQPHPAVSAAFTPLLTPIALIALRSVADLPGLPFGQGWFYQVIMFLGNPVTALLIGVLLSFTLKSRKVKESAMDWVGEGLKSAGVIILITGAGGAFGGILRATHIGDTLGNALSQWQIGIFLPFIIAAVLKTAQGSSTVAIITTAALVSPLLPAMGLDSSLARALVVLAIGAGSMTVSHANDSYFWVVEQFSDMDTATALKCHTMATLMQGLVGIAVIALLTMVMV
ncbi:MAG TPA: GntP family permease [bacterium]|nr:GntP family permease [bacterium]HPN44238.1 GntP family permease [bacterium]